MPKIPKRRPKGSIPAPLRGSKQLLMRESTNTAEVYWEASAILLRKNLKHILRTLGYQTFERFAHEHQIPKSTLSQLIHHTRNPRLSTMDAVAKALGVSLSALFSLPQPLPPDWKDL